MIGRFRRFWAGLDPRVGIALAILTPTVIAGAGILTWKGFDRCGPGVTRQGPHDECVGVTDGDVVFRADLAPVMRQIREENHRVERSGKPWVSIAYLVPLPTPNSQDPSLPEILRHELQGAHIAQRFANHTKELGEQPLIRLLVASAGEENRQWEPAANRLLDLVGSERLLAVVGLGESREGTRLAIERLTEGGLPVIAARPTADQLSNAEEFARVGPLTSAQVKALTVYLKQDPAIRTALLVQDVNRTDPYAEILGDTFLKVWPDAAHQLLQPVEEFDAALLGVADRFTQMRASICAQRPDVVFFAGRGSNLEALIEVLPGRTCPDFPITIVTAASGVRTAIVLAHQGDDGPLKKGLESGVTFRYASQAHPGAWVNAGEFFSAAPIGHFQKECGDCFTSLFPKESLNDGAAIMGHDAVLTAVKAIRATVGQEDDPVKEPISPGEVTQQFRGLHGAYAVEGASGWISLDRDGNPTGKAIAILELSPDGSVRFLQVASGSETPFRPPDPLIRSLDRGTASSR